MMLSGQKCFIAFLVTFTFCLSVSPTHARSVSPPWTYKVNSPDDKFIFVMIAPLSIESEMSTWNEEKRTSIRAIRSLYPRSGLYRNDGSRDPLWTVDWYSSSVEVASDGIHLVRHSTDFTSLNDEAISFYANGELLRMYNLRDMVDFPTGFAPNFLGYKWINQLYFVNNKLQCIVTTVDGNQLTFDMQTGEIVSASRPGRWLVGGLLLSMTVILCGLVWVFERKRKRV